MDEALRTAATYERNADAYREKYLGGSVAADHGAPFLDALDGDRVLDVGCGPGSDAAVFAGAGLDVVGVDLTQSFLAAARESADGGFLRGDMRSLPVATDSVDGVWCCAALLHLPKADAPAAVREFERVLRDDGVCFCSLKRGGAAGFEPDDDHGDGDERFFARYARDEAAALFAAAGFDVDVRVDDRWVTVLASPGRGPE